MSKDLTATQSILQLKCPRCRKGDLFIKPGFFVFNGMSTMPERCSHCNLKYDREPGFFWGAMYISYGIAAFIDLPAFIIFFAVCRLEYWWAMGAVALLTVILVSFIFRISRSIWIHMFVSFGGDGDLTWIK